MQNVRIMKLFQEGINQDLFISTGLESVVDYGKLDLCCPLPVGIKIEYYHSLKWKYIEKNNWSKVAERNFRRIQPTCWTMCLCTKRHSAWNHRDSHDTMLQKVYSVHISSKEEKNIFTMPANTKASYIEVKFHSNGMAQCTYQHIWYREKLWLWLDQYQWAKMGGGCHAWRCGRIVSFSRWRELPRRQWW